jgi:serine/threonine protein kinase
MISLLFPKLRTIREYVEVIDIEIIKDESPVFVCWLGLISESLDVRLVKIACTDRPPLVPGTLSPLLRAFTLSCLDLDPNARPSAKELLKHPVFHPEASESPVLGNVLDEENVAAFD